MYAIRSPNSLRVRLVERFSMSTKLNLLFVPRKKLSLCIRYLYRNFVLNYKIVIVLRSTFSYREPQKLL